MSLASRLFPSERDRDGMNDNTTKNQVPYPPEGGGGKYTYCLNYVPGRLISQMTVRKGMSEQTQSWKPLGCITHSSPQYKGNKIINSKVATLYGRLHYCTG